MSLSGSPRSRCTITVSHTLVVPRSGPSATLLRHYASRRVCQAVTCLAARRLPGRSLPYHSIFFRSKEIHRESTIPIPSCFVRPKRAMRLRSTRTHENRSRVSTRMRTYFQIIENNGFDLSSRKMHTWIKSIVIRIIKHVFVK